MKYRDWLLDPRWQEFRLRVFERDGWTCQLCGFCSRAHQDAPGRLDSLHAHHVRYLPQRRPWEYALADVVTLCEPCHAGQKRSGGLTPVAKVVPDALTELAVPSLRDLRHSRAWQAILDKFGVDERRYDERVCIICWAAWRVDLTRCADCRRAA